MYPERDSDSSRPLRPQKPDEHPLLTDSDLIGVLADVAALCRDSHRVSSRLLNRSIESVPAAIDEQLAGAGESLRWALLDVAQSVLERAGAFVSWPGDDDWPFEPE